MEQDRTPTPEESSDGFITELRSATPERRLGRLVDGAMQRFSRFRRGVEDQSVIFKADFVLNNNDPYDSLNIVIDGQEDTEPVRYFDFYKKMMEAIDNDIESDDFMTGTLLKVKPEAETEGLRKYIRENPHASLRCTYLIIDLLSFSDEKDEIACTIDFNPVTNLPVATIWRAHRSRNIFRG